MIQICITEIWTSRSEFYLQNLTSNFFKFSIIFTENFFRLKDIAKYKYEFERDVTVDIARNAKGGVRYSADRYIRFTEEKLKSKEALIEKLRLKNAKMSDQNRKISHQLKVGKYDLQILKI